MIQVENTADENALQILNVLQDYIGLPDTIPALLDKMATEYVLVDDMEQLVEGRYVRWIREGVMTRGGIVLQVGSAEPGKEDMVLCKTPNHILVKFRFGDCPCFAKLNQFEQWYMLHNTETKDQETKDQE